MTVKGPLLALPLLLLGCEGAERNTAQEAAKEAPMPPHELPVSAEVADACYSDPGEMMAEEARLSQQGVFIEPTFEEFIIRNVSCDWRVRERNVAFCRFEQGSIPMGSQEPPERARHLARMRDRDWHKAEAVLSYASPEGWSCELVPQVEGEG